jgi:drug/metabolite transporter (DMT)-like permease
MTATVLILLSAIVHAIVNVLTKRANDKYAMRLLMGGFAVLIVFPLAFFVPLPEGNLIAILIASGIVHAVYELLLIKSYENGAFSAAYPVARGTGPLFTALGAALIFSEKIFPLQLLGILLVSAGVIAIGISHRAAAGANKGFAYALATGAIIGVYTGIDAAGIRAAPNPATFLVWFWFGWVFLLFAMPGFLRGKEVYLEAGRHWKLGVGLGALAVVSYSTALLAFRLGPTAELAALRETSVLFGTLLAVLLLGEKMTPKRWIAACIVAIGAILAQSA